ncbi:MAG: DUF58 domain-containing protein [Capsulimonadales bacterium]|nr:DUF58 domain-containing protein [Capsulimonadales bacterium]
MSVQSRFLEPEFLRALERLSGTARRPFSGPKKGEKRPLRPGASPEVSDFRPYGIEDDPRHVDRQAFLRPERLFQRLFSQEDVSIHLLLDASQSMEYPVETFAGRMTKFDFARKIAASIGYVSLIRYDRVSVACFAQTVGSRVPTLRGQASAPRLFEYLESLSPGGRTDFVHALRNYTARHSSPGICIVLSDFFDPNWERGVRALLSRRFEVVLLQILAPEEAEPNVVGDLRLVDAVTGETREVSITPAVLANYREAFHRFCASLSELSQRHGMDYLQTTTDAPVEEMLLRTLRNAGLLS